MSKRSASATAGAPSASSPSIKLPSANPLWLHASADDKYLLLEDPETGDVLMPLIYMKPILEANYSRKLAALKHRQVTVPESSPLAEKNGLLYWQWAFEAPLCIKNLVRKELGEENTPQGHLRLVLVPIVYNALAVREDMHKLPLFRALHMALKQSSYWQLLIPPPSSVAEELESEEAEDARPGQQQALFSGPITLEATAKKYMFCFRDAFEVEQSKKARTTGAFLQQEGAAIIEATVTRGRDKEQQPGVSNAGATSLGGASTVETLSDQAAGAAEEEGAGGGVNSQRGPPPEQQQQQQVASTGSPHRRQGRAQPPLARKPSGSRQTAPDVQRNGRTSRADGLDSQPSLQARPQAQRQGQQQAKQQQTGALQQEQVDQAQEQHGARLQDQLPQSQGLLLLQIRQVLQQELLPLQQQVELLSEEVASLKRNVVQRLTLAATTNSGGQAAVPPQLPPAWPLLPSQKSNEMQMPQTEDVQRGTPASAGGTELGRVLPQNLGATWPRLQQEQSKEQQAGGPADPGQFQHLNRPGGYHLGPSPLASLNFLMEQFNPRSAGGTIPPPREIFPPPASTTQPTVGVGGGRPPGPGPWSKPGHDRQHGTAANAAAAPNAANSLGTDNNASARQGAVSALAAAADVLAQAAGVGAPGGLDSSATALLPPELRDLLQGQSQAEANLNWGQLLGELGTGGLDAALHALTQQHSMPRQQQQQQQASAAMMAQAGSGGGIEEPARKEGQQQQTQPHHQNLDDVLMQLSMLKQAGRP